MTTIASRFILIISLSLSTLIGAMHFINTSSPNPISALFTNADGTPCAPPCLFGIQPGETTFMHAIELLRAHPLTRDFRQNSKLPIFRGTLNGHPMGVILTSDGGNLLLFAELTPVSEDPYQLPWWKLPGRQSGFAWGSLGEVVSALGPPDLVGVDGTFTQSYYLNEELLFYHTLSTAGYATVDQPFDTLFVFAPHSKITPLKTALFHWQGFGRTQRYLIYGNP